MTKLPSTQTETKSPSVMSYKGLHDEIIHVRYLVHPTDQQTLAEILLCAERIVLCSWQRISKNSFRTKCYQV